MAQEQPPDHGPHFENGDGGEIASDFLFLDLVSHYEA